ncbi:MAG: hypothetical protein JWQ14_1388 [Adhaeribacter sp.]|nr:hypothetical protein [Adhaeribacter sp.]
MFKNLFILLFITFLFTQCTEEISPTDTFIGREYFPVKVGNYWIYEVSEIRVSNNKYDSLKYQLREIIDTVYTNAMNEQTYRVKFSRKRSNDLTWKDDSLLVLNKSNSDVRRTHNNVNVVKLVFPVKSGRHWNANGFNTRENEEYYYSQVNQPFVLNNITYDTTVTVVQAEPNEIILDDRTEVYAYQVGMIYKNHTVYEYAQSSNTTDKTRVVKGYKRVLKLKTFYSAE